MKLYVWEDPYPVLYGTSLVYAVADSLEAAKDAARRNAEDEHKYRSDFLGGVELGEPTRILDVPCAEWHEWSE